MITKNGFSKRFERCKPELEVNGGVYGVGTFSEGCRRI